MHDLRPEMLRSPGDDIAKLSLIDIAGWNLHDTIIASSSFKRTGHRRAEGPTLLARHSRFHFGELLTNIRFRSPEFNTLGMIHRALSNNLREQKVGKQFDPPRGCSVAGGSGMRVLYVFSDPPGSFP